jgi:hypothetical protein
MTNALWTARYVVTFSRLAQRKWTDRQLEYLKQGFALCGVTNELHQDALAFKFMKDGSVRIGTLTSQTSLETWYKARPILPSLIMQVEESS